MRLIDAKSKKNSARTLLAGIDQNNEQFNNGAYHAYAQISNLSLGYLALTTQELKKERIDLPSDFGLPFNQAINLYRSDALTANTRVSFATFHKFAPRCQRICRAAPDALSAHSY